MDNVKELKLTISSALAVVFYFIGWQGALFILLALAMAIDYITGSAVARSKGEWESKKATEGRIKKALVFVAIIIAVILDSLIMILIGHTSIFTLPFEWPYLFTVISLVWFILSEAGSTLENLANRGVNLPNFLVKGIRILKGKVETAGDQLLKEEEKSE